MKLWVLFSYVIKNVPNFPFGDSKIFQINAFFLYSYNPGSEKCNFSHEWNFLLPFWSATDWGIPEVLHFINSRSYGPSSFWFFQKILKFINPLHWDVLFFSNSSISLFKLNLNARTQLISELESLERSYFVRFRLVHT